MNPGLPLRKSRPVDMDRAACYFNYGSNMCRLGASGAGGPFAATEPVVDADI